MLYIEKVFCLTLNETLRLGVGHHNKNETSKQNTRDHIVGSHRIRHRITGNAHSSTRLFRVEEWRFREKRLFVIAWKTHIAPASTNGMTRQMKCIRTFAPCNLAGFDMCLNGRILLFGRSILGQPADDFSRSGLLVHASGCTLKVLLYLYTCDRILLLSHFDAMKKGRKATLSVLLICC